MSGVTVVSGSKLVISGGQTAGMARSSAITDLSNQLCGSVMIAAPHSASGIHHHGPQDTIIYAVRGRGSIISNGGKTRQDLQPGDWAFIPGGCEHQEVNEGDEEVVWAITRGGKEPVVENLEGWGK